MAAPKEPTVDKAVDKAPTEVPMPASTVDQIDAMLNSIMEVARDIENSEHLSSFLMHISNAKTQLLFVKQYTTSSESEV